MIKNSKKQNGSAHVVIIIILVVALICALGFVFWQNFIKSDSTKEITNSGSETSKDQVGQTVEMLSYSNETIGVKFDYPKNWVKVECDSTYVENPQNIAYFGTNNYGVGIVEGDESNLCGGGTDFPPQAIVTRVTTRDEFTGSYTDVTIDGKSAKKYANVASQDDIQPGLETTRYVVDMGSDQYIVFAYNRFPEGTNDERDNSESSLRDFTKLVEKNVRFL